MIHRRSVCQVPVHRRSVPSACTDTIYLLQLQQSLETILKLSVQNTTSGMNFWYVLAFVFQCFFNTNLSHRTASVKHSLHVYVSVLSTTSPLSLCLSLSLNVALWVGWKYGLLFLVLKEKRSDILYAVIRRKGFLAQPVFWFALAISWVWVACVYGDCLQCSI